MRTLSSSSQDGDSRNANVRHQNGSPQTDGRRHGRSTFSQTSLEQETVQWMPELSIEASLSLYVNFLLQPSRIVLSWVGFLSRL